MAIFCVIVMVVKVVAMEDMMDMDMGNWYGGGDDMIMRNSQCHPLSSVPISSFHSLSIHLFFLFSVKTLPTEAKKLPRNRSLCVGS